MKFFLDENIPIIVKDILEKENHCVFDIRGSEKEGLSDSEIFQLSKENKAVFISTDKDFFHTIHFLYKPHYGIVVIALAQPNSSKIVEKINWFLKESHSLNMENKCILISDNKCIIYK